MKQALIDTNILSMFFRGHPSVVARFDAYTSLYSTVNTSIITYYEILSGLKHRGAQKQLATFLEFAAQNNSFPSRSLLLHCPPSCMRPSEARAHQSTTSTCLSQD